MTHSLITSQGQWSIIDAEDAIRARQEHLMDLDGALPLSSLWADTFLVPLQAHVVSRSHVA